MLAMRSAPRLAPIIPLCVSVVCACGESEGVGGARDAATDVARGGDVSSTGGRSGSGGASSGTGGLAGGSGGTVSGSGGAGGAAGTSSGDIVATACRRMCDTLQSRIDCPDKSCLLGCVVVANGDPATCAQNLDTFTNCLAQRPASDFICSSNGYADVKTGVCYTEQIAVYNC
jgi:hypothetical protein